MTSLSDAVYRQTEWEAIAQATNLPDGRRDETLQPLTVKQDGVWSNGWGNDTLDWHPYMELDEPITHSPAHYPYLPFPFSARQLAAFMLDGLGYFVRECFGGWDDGPLVETLDAMPAKALTAKHAVKCAFKAYRVALREVGNLDPTYAQRLNELSTIEQTAWQEARAKFGFENTAQSSTYKKAKAATQQARRKADEAHAEWRKKMVQHLLKTERNGANETPRDHRTTLEVDALDARSRASAGYRVPMADSTNRFDPSLDSAPSNEARQQLQPAPLPPSCTLLEAAEWLTFTTAKAWTIRALIGCAARGELTVFGPLQSEAQLVRVEPTTDQQNETTLQPGVIAPLDSTSAAKLLHGLSTTFTGLDHWVKLPGLPPIESSYVIGQVWAIAEGTEAPKVFLKDCTVRAEAVERLAKQHTALSEQPAEVTEQVQQSAETVCTPLPADPAEKRAWLLEKFRGYGGKRPGEPGKKGQRGALAKLERETRIDDKNLGQMLDKAIEEKKAAELWAPLKRN